MGINVESDYKRFDVVLKEDDRFHLRIREEELVDVMKELMTPFLMRYVHDLILDFTESMAPVETPEDMRDYKDAGGTGTRAFDIQVSYITYNDGHFVDPNAHGGPIILSVEERGVNDPIAIIDDKESDFTRSEINQFQQEESKLRKIKLGDE